MSAGTALLCLFFVGLIGVAALAPVGFAPLLGVTALLGLVLLAWRHLIGISVVWLFLTGASLEMTLYDLIGPSAYPTTIAVVKTVQLGLAALCLLRYGAQIDPFNPAWGFLAIFAVGLLHGLHPGLTTSDSLRSLAGSIAPFAFCFSRIPREWGHAIIRATRWLPLSSLAGGVALDIAGLRPLFVESGGMRLAGLGHPAFLAGICLAAIYACLIQLYRNGARRHLLLLAANFVILGLTGARAPLVYGGLVTAITFALIPAPTMPRARRWVLLLGGITALALLVLFALLDHALSDLRLFNLFTNGEAVYLSGRDLLWPRFEQAANQSYWLGWGLGAGNFIIPSDSPLAQLLRTWAAHNEYLRIEVEGGQIGRTFLVTSFVLWVISHTRRLPRPERHIMRLVFVAFAAHALTDNVLISTPASVLFSFVAAVFASRASAKMPGLGSCLQRSATLA